MNDLTKQEMNQSNITLDDFPPFNESNNNFFFFGPDSQPVPLYNIRHFLNLSERDFVPPEFSDRIRTCLLCSFLFIIFMAVIGNCFVIFIVCKNPKMRTVTNTFLVSLAVSDLFIACINMPVQLHYYLANQWIFGSIVCKSARYIQGVSIAASILTLTGIAFDRYYAILYPFQARHVHTSRRAVTLLLVFWTLSLIIISPQILVQRLDYLLDRKSPLMKFVTVCQEYFPARWMEITYSMSYMTLLNIIPVVIILVTYIKIAHRLWFRPIIGDTYDQRREDERRLKEKKRVIRMLIVIVVLFTLCWLPFFACQVYLTFNYDVNRNILIENDTRIMVAFFQLVGYSNSCTNPVVYWFMNDNFQQHFLQTCCLARRPRRASSTDTSRRRSHSSLDFERVLQSSTNQSSV